MSRRAAIMKWDTLPTKLQRELSKRRIHGRTDGRHWLSEDKSRARPPT